MDHPLRRWRKSQGLTLAEAARLVGTVKNVWWSWEHKTRRPGALFMKELRRITGGEIDANTFYSDDEPEVQ
jgi:transcriptional regulator with XRE-family HTH domain